MKIFRLVLLAAFIIVQGNLGFSLKAPDFNKETLYRYEIRLATSDKAEIGSLSRWLNEKGFDVAGIKWLEATIEVITNRQGVEFLESHGVRGAIKSQKIPGEDVADAPDARYLNPSTLDLKLKSIHKANPTLTRLEQIGTSIQGRPVWGLLLSTTPTPNDPRSLAKPSIIFDGLHHAREVMTPEIVVDVAEYLLSQVSKPEILDLLSRWNIWLVPMVNVDGSNIVFTQNNWWRKNARASQEKVHGVDVNRNYNFRWDSCNGSSGAPNSDTYRGASAGSEPETQALMGLADRVQPAASISYHSYSELVLYPYGCQGAYPAEKALVKMLAEQMAGKIPADSGRGTYTPGTPWELLYSVDGGSMDYMYGKFGALAYVFEVNQDFQPDYGIREATVAKQRPAWMYFLNFIDKNMLKVVVIDDRTQKTAAGAQVDIDTVIRAKDELPFRTNEAGNFFKVLDAGNYAVSVKLADGRRGEGRITKSASREEITIHVQ